MSALIALARAYPWRTATILALLVVASTVEGVSLTALLPVLTLAVDRSAGAEASLDPFGRFFVEGLERLGVAPTLGILIAVVVGGLTVRSLLVLGARRQVGYTLARVVTDMRLELLRALLGARWEFFLRQRIGTLANAMSSEIERAGRAYDFGAQFAALTIQTTVYGVVALLLSWQATLIYLGCAGLLALALHGLVRMARRAGRRHTTQLRWLVSDLTDNLQSVKSLKAMGREHLADELVAGRAESLMKALRSQVLAKEGLRAAQQPVFALVAGAGAWLGLVQWGLPASKVMVLLVLLVRILQNVGKVQSGYQALVTCEPAYWAVERTIREARQQMEAPSGVKGPSLERGIELENVQFGYGDTTVLQDCSLAIPAGSLTLLIGSSGAGKTTVLDLVIGLLRPDEGAVRVDGVSLDECDATAWRRSIGYVPQENLLLHDTILRNVTLGDPLLGAADAERALRAAGAWDFVASQPDGLASVVGERGTKLSSGQRQRIVLARALAHEPGLLILDEATSALDPQTEAAVWETLEGLRGDMTVLAVTHRLALVERADRVYRLEKGRAIPLAGASEA